MFLCARDASARPQGASDDAQAAPHSPADAQVADPRPPRAPALQRPPFRRADDAQASAAYLQVLDALTRLVAQLLDVHTLSPSLRFAAGESVAVDAAEWWREVQRQSIARVQRQERAETANDRAEDTEKSSSSRLWPLAARSQEKTLEQEQRSKDSGVLASSEAFEDLPGTLGRTMRRASSCRLCI